MAKKTDKQTEDTTPDETASESTSAEVASEESAAPAAGGGQQVQQTIKVDDSTVNAGYANFCRVSSRSRTSISPSLVQLPATWFSAAAGCPANVTRQSSTMMNFAYVIGTWCVRCSMTAVFLDTMWREGRCLC